MIRRLIDWIGLRLTQRRINPAAKRGRCWEKKNGDDTSPSTVRARNVPTAEISARIIRADGTVTDLGRVN